MGHRSAELRATLNATRKLAKKIVKKLKNVVARSLKAEDVKTKLAKAYKLKLSQYLLLMAKLQNQKRSVGKMLVVLGARRSRTGQKLATERKIHNTVDERYRVTMSRQVHSLRSRERKLLRLLNGESARFTNKMAILNRNARALSRIKERMLHVSELELKESEKKLAQSENRLRVQIKTASALIAQARRASRFQKAGLAKETETEHRKGMKAVAHLGRLRKAVEGQVRSHKRGNLKKLSSEKSRLQHLMVIVAKDSKNLAKKRKLMAKQFSKKIKHVAKQSIKAIVRERKWRKWLTATLQREVSQTQGHHNKERQIMRGEKTYAHIIQGLKAMIQGEHGLYNKMSKMLHGAKVKKQRLEFFKHEISKKTRQSGKQQAWRLREMEKLKWGMHGILQRLLKAHAQVKYVLSALKAEKIEGEARLVHTIKRIKKKGVAVHLRARWSSRLNKYKRARAKLYKKLVQSSMLLAKEIEMRQKKIEQQSRQKRRRRRMEINRKHMIGHMRERVKRYAAHLEEQTLKILKKKKSNDASKRRFQEIEVKTLRRLQRKGLGDAVNAKKLHEESLAHSRSLRNKKNEIMTSVLRKRRLREVMIGELAKKKKISTQMRVAQKRSQRYIYHAHKQLEAIKDMKNNLLRLRRKVREQKVKQKHAVNRAAKLDKTIIAGTALLQRVQAESADVVAALRRSRAERAMLMLTLRSWRGNSIKALLREVLAGKGRQIRALERKLKNLEGWRTKRNDKKMKQRIIREVTEEKLAISNSVMELQRVGGRIKHLMNELQSGKYNNNAQLRKFELRKQRRNGKWRRKLHKAENELKHHKARERELIIAFKNARMRVVGLLAKVSAEDAREIKNLKQGTLQAMRAGHRKMWRSISRFIAQQAEKLQQLITVQRRYLLELHHIEKQQSTLLILLRRRNVGTSRALQHVLQRRVQWLREIRKRIKTFKRMMKYLSRKMRNEKHKAINRMRMTNLRGSRRFRKMVLHIRQNFRAAATKESHLVFKLRKAWLRLHKALQRCRRMMRMHVMLRKSGQAKRAQRLSQETRRLTMLLHKEEEKDSLLLKHQRLWTSERVRKWRVKLIKQMKKAHSVTTALALEIKSAKK